MANRLHSSVGSIKHALIDKSNTRIVVTISIAVFAVVFSLVSTKTLWSQATYQNRVISEKNKAKNQLKENLEVVKKFKPSYDTFVGATTNIIAGNAFGIGPQDGNNAKIILDALPSKYDFPALATNLETLVQSQGVALTALSGTDDEVSQAANISSPDPQPVEMPFEFSATGDYAKTQALVSAIERSVRPIKINSIDISGNQGSLTTSISAVTYYQPAKSLKIRTTVVK